MSIHIFIENEMPIGITVERCVDFEFTHKLSVARLDVFAWSAMFAVAVMAAAAGIVAAAAATVVAAILSAGIMTAVIMVCCQD